MIAESHSAHGATSTPLFVESSMVQHNTTEDLHEKPEDASRLLYILFSTLLVLLLGTFAFNVMLDPTADWGTDLAPPLLRTSREVKVELVERMTPKPRVLILGSSRVMKFEPDEVAKYIGGPVFNAGVNSARVEDYLAMLRYVLEDLNAPVTHIVVGIDLGAFSNSIPMGARLSNIPELARQLDNSTFKDLKQHLNKATRTISIAHLKLSLKSLYYRLTSYPKRRSHFKPDGYLYYDVWDDQIARGTFDPAPLIKGSQSEYVRRMEGYTALSVERIAHFRTLIALCERRDIRVTVFITALHPSLDAFLTTTIQDYARLKRDLDAFLDAESRGSFRYVRTWNIADYGGHSQDFYDGAHPTTTNTRLQLLHIFQDTGG
jgi:hypothetical protein